MKIEELLSRLERVKRSGEGWIAKCPAHDDKNPSLSITQKDDHILLHCHAGCDLVDICDALRMQVSELYVSSYPPKRLHNNISESKTEKKRHLRLVQVKNGDLHMCISDYAQEKNLPVSFLEGFGLSDSSYGGKKRVCIPYYDANREEVARRYRTRNSNGDKVVTWRKGDSTILYGLWLLDPKPNYIVIVEGESDVHTLSYHGIPVLGLPGANIWRDDRDAQHFDGIERIYVIREPDQGGETVERWLSQSSIRNRVLLVSLGDHKDPSELYLADPDNFSANFQKALDAAIPWPEIEQECREAARRESWEVCKELAQQENILDLFVSLLPGCGLVGEDKAAKILFLALVTRLFDRITNTIVDGPSSGGKSFLVDSVLKFFPESAFHELSGMSERTLAYTDEPLSHRFLILLEAAGMGGEFGTYLIRSLLSEGKIRYEYVDKGPFGLESKLIEKEGPTGLIMTTTRVWIHAENETRMIRVTVNDTREQTEKVFLALANEIDEINFDPWHALQEWLAGGESCVVIPFATDIARLTKPLAVRLRRDFNAMLSLIRAHALLHQYHRDRDDQGRIIAALDDYGAVLDLVGDVISDGVSATVRESVRETVKAAEDAIAKVSGDHVTIREISDQLELDRSATTRRVETAIRHGFLKHMDEGFGKKKRTTQPRQIGIGDPLPEDQNIFPTVEDLQDTTCTPAQVPAQVKDEENQEDISNLCSCADDLGGKAEHIDEEEFARREREAIQIANGIPPDD